MTIQPLKWSVTSKGVLNGKVGPLTLFTVFFHTGENRYFVSAKVPGFSKSIPVGSEEEGVTVAIRMHRRYVRFLVGLEPSFK